MDTAAPSDRFRDRMMAVLPAIAAEKGWTDAALRVAALEAGLSEGEAQLALPGGLPDAMDAFADRADRAMLAVLAEADLAGMKVRARVTLAVRERLLAQAAHKEAARRLTYALALPTRAGLGPQLVWRTADRIWRALSDPSTDFNFYSKRAILCGVLASTYARWIADETPDHAETFAFLDDRIANVMQFEKLKAQAAPFTKALGGWAQWAGQARYGAGQ
jgi:ubiquinone biosynthesis protein COQ9